MSIHPVDSLIGIVEQALAKSAAPEAYDETARAVEGVFHRSHTLIGPIAHTKEARDWIRFAARNERVPRDPLATVIASQAVGLLRQIRNVWTVAIDVLVVAALDDELQALRKLLVLERHEHPFLHERGKHDDHDVVIIRCIGMGLVDAAITTTRALCHFRPRLAVMIGVCGAVAAKAKIGDVIVANPAFHYQFGAFDDGFLRHELKTVPLKDQLAEVAETFAAEAFERLRSAFESERELRPPKPSRMIVAPMACADLVVKDTRKIKEADEAERKTTGVDMESYAVMRTCRAINDVPCIVIKAVQDVMTEKTDDYRRYAADLATAVLLGILPRLVATT